MKHIDAERHVRGASRFIDDLPEPAGLLHAAVVTAPIADGKLISLDCVEAKQLPEIHAVLTARDIPGINQIGNIVEDEPLLVEGTVHFVGQPLALVIADTPRAARRGAAAIVPILEERSPLFDVREAARQGAFIVPPRTVAVGDVDAAWRTCHTVIEGKASTGAQEHLYLETQGALAIPTEKGGIALRSATQSPTAVQRITAKVLDLPMNRVTVETARLGGAFGGKEDQATPWAALAALAAHTLRRPVKMVLSREEDIRLTGKRHPYEFDYKLGLDEIGRMVAYEATLYQNSGAAADLSPAVLERSLLHVTAAYAVPNVRVTGLAVKTNLPPFTAFRGFGAPQAIFCMEAALDHAAGEMGIPRRQLQRLNLLESGDSLPSGMIVEDATAVRSFEEALTRYDVAEMERAAETFNRNHAFFKQGISVMPICFGISFTNTFLNQAGALVHVYTDGTVAVSSGAVEMGQGVSTKLVTIAAASLGIPEALIGVENTDTSRVANTSPTAASTGADLNGMAVKIACDGLRARLLGLAAELMQCSRGRLTLSNGIVMIDERSSGMTWQELVGTAYGRRLNLSAQAHYATPDIHYDKQKEKGRPFAYHVFGCAVTQVTLDVLRGEYRVDEVKIVHDAGRPLNEQIDRGQVEGALIQGIGWMTLEEIVYEKGRLLTNSLSTYKIPDLPATPTVAVCFLDNADNPAAGMKSKAVGEPPFLYGIGAFFALLDALRAAAPEAAPGYDAPLTNEKVLIALCKER